MASRPTEKPEWTQGNPGVQDEPTGSEKFGGFAPNERPPAQWVNWILANLSDWVDWLDQQEQLASEQVFFDATVGSGGTYADINALVAAIVLGADIKNVLVISNITVSATQVIPNTIADLRIWFKKGCTIAKGAATTPGIAISGNRVEIRNGRFSSFSGGSDVAIQMEAASKNCRIVDNDFVTCTTAVANAGSNNQIAGTIEEV